MLAVGVHANDLEQMVSKLALVEQRRVSCQVCVYKAFHSPLTDSVPEPTRAWRIRLVSGEWNCTNGLFQPGHSSRCSGMAAGGRASTMNSPRAASAISAHGYWGATCSARSAGLGSTQNGRAGGATTLHITLR